MKKFEWDKEKNEILKQERWVSFEAVIEAINNWNQLDDIPHKNKEKYPNQRIIIVNIDNYALGIPYVFTKEKNKFLKTIIPSRVYTKIYLK